MIKNCGKMRYILLTMLMLCVAILGSAMNVNAAMSKSAQHKLYKTTMKNYANKAKASYKRNSPNGGSDAASRKVMYLFVDIDKNGIDELVMRYGIPTYDRNTAKGSGYGESTSIYTIKNGKVVTVLNHSNVIPARHDNFVHIFKNRNRIDMGFSHGYDDHTFCEYSNGKLYTNSNTIWMTATSSRWSYNQKSISRSSYQAKYRFLTNNGTGYTMKIYK